MDESRWKLGEKNGRRWGEEGAGGLRASKGKRKGPEIFTKFYPLIVAASVGRYSRIYSAWSAELESWLRKKRPLIEYLRLFN